MNALDWLRDALRTGFEGLRAGRIAYPVRRDEQDAAIDVWIAAILLSGAEFQNDEDTYDAIQEAFARLVLLGGEWPQVRDFLALYRSPHEPDRDQEAQRSSAHALRKIEQRIKTEAARAAEALATSSGAERAREREEESERRAAASRLGRAKLQAVLAEIERRRHEDDVRRARSSAALGSIAEILANAARRDQERTATAAQPGETPGATRAAEGE